jgi:hypothetical protein
MMHKACVLGLFLFFATSNANADVLVGIEHNLPIEKLQFIPKAIARAANREAPTAPVYFPVSDSIMLECPPLKPDSQGNGCYLLVDPTTTTSLGQLIFSLRKPVQKDLLVKKIVEITEKTSATNANTTEDHLHIGNPLYSQSNGMKDGTHYYCAPEGEAGKRTWQCYLSVAETIKQAP